jgi:hypothetical protein
MDEDPGLPLAGLLPATLRRDQTGYYVFGRVQGLEQIAAELLVTSQSGPPEEAAKKVDQIAALRSPKLRFVSNEQNMRCSLFIALGKELLITSAMVPEVWGEAKKMLFHMLSATEMLALGRATTERRFEEAFALVGTSGLYRLGVLYEKTAGTTNSDSPLYQALVASDGKAGGYQLSKQRQLLSVVASDRKADSLALRLQELCFQNAIPASALMRVSHIVAAEVAITSVAEEQQRWTDVAHFRRISDSAAKPSVPKVPSSGRQRPTGVDLDSRKGSSKTEP